MGLDMYLSGKRYLNCYCDNGDKKKAQDISDMFPELHGWQDEGNSVVKEVIIRVGYWRKANAIHKWFVDNIQKGKDDCNPYYVSRKSLIELRGECDKALQNRDNAAGILPPQEGFFFGGTDIDDWYFRDLENTINIVDKLLTLPDDWSFEYQSSW